MSDLNVDIEAQFASSLEEAIASQLESEEMQQKLQHAEELAQRRAQRLAERTASQNPPAEAEPETRLSMMDRLLQQTTSQRPSARRRVRQHPRRSASFHTGDTNVEIANDIQNFREAFEAARSNLFGSRTSGSVDSVSRLPATQRSLDIPTSLDGSAPNSGSSTPRIQRRDEADTTQPARGLDDPFASVMSSLGIGTGSNSNLSDTGQRNGSRSSSVTREGRTSSGTTNLQRFMMSGNAEVARSSIRNGRNENRRSRMTERRRRTVGVTPSDVREALDLTSSGSRERLNQITSSETRPSNQENISLTRDSFQYSSYVPRYQREVKIDEHSTRPILALSDETTVYIDEKGHCHWLEKSHPLLKAVKDNATPSIIVNYKEEMIKTNEEVKDSVTDIPGDPEDRYNKLRELIKNSRNREGSCDNGDFVNTTNGENDSVGQDEVDSKRISKKNLGIDPAYTIEAIEERFKHVSYYTKPRSRPNISNYKLMRKCKSIYDYEGNENSEITDDGRYIDTYRLESSQVNTDVTAVGSVHITVTDTANRVDNLNISRTPTEEMRTSIIESVGTVNETRANNRSYVDFRSDISDRMNGYRSAILHRSTSLQEYRPVSSGLGEASTSRLVRHGSLENTFSRYSGLSNSRNNSGQSDLNEEKELIANELQQRQAYAEIPIDTSHLDIEEMRMIQKALEENPSPPPSPVDFELTGDMVSEGTENLIIETHGSSNVTHEPVASDSTKGDMVEFGPLSPVQEANSEAELTPGPDTDHSDPVHAVFNEFVSTVNEEHTLNLPRGFIFNNSH